MRNKIFISYRRDDAPGDARSIREGLVSAFGRGSVFMDVDNLNLGQRFDVELAKALSDCHVLIAVIGVRWLEQLKARDVGAERDYVREEIAEALRRKISVVPVRVGREGSMPPLPRPEELPEDLRDLVLHQKCDIAHERFARDLSDLVSGIITLRRSDASSGQWHIRQSGLVRWIGVALAFAVAVGGAVYAIGSANHFGNGASASKEQPHSVTSTVPAASVPAPQSGYESTGVQPSSGASTAPAASVPAPQSGYEPTGVQPLSGAGTTPPASAPAAQWRYKPSGDPPSSGNSTAPAASAPAAPWRYKPSGDPPSSGNSAAPAASAPAAQWRYKPSGDPPSSGNSAAPAAPAPAAPWRYIPLKDQVPRTSDRGGGGGD